MTASHKLYYWPIPFRGHFIRYMLAMAKLNWEEATFDEVAAFKTADPARQRYPVLAPPMLEDCVTGRQLSQMPAIFMGLGRTYRMITNEDLALRLICDASDILFEITRYHGALMWDDDSWKTFVDQRLPRWLAVHEAIVPELYADGPGGEEIAVTALWHTMIDRLPPLRAVVAHHAPELTRLVDQVAKHRAIARVIADWADRKPIYCGGQIEASLLNVLKMETDT